MSVEEPTPPPDQSGPSQDQGDQGDLPPPNQDDMDEAAEGVARLAGMGFEPTAAASARATGGDPGLLTHAAAQGLSA
jgi:hypothetical protein